MRHSIKFLSGLLATAICFGTVSQATPAQALQRGGVLRIVSLGEPELLNPVFDNSNSAREIYNLIFSSLIRRNSQSQLEPDLLTVVPTVQNGMIRSLANGEMEVTYTLRPNLLWQDGHALTAEDIQFTWMAHTDPRFNYPPTPGYENIRMVEVIDPQTARVTFFQTYTDYPNLFKYILPKHSFRSKYWSFSAEHPWNSHPVGSGPFVLKDWKKGEMAIFDANPLYHRAKPNLDQIRYQFKESNYSAIPGVVNWVQGADIVQGMSIVSYDYLKENPNLELHLRNTGRIEHIEINTKQPVLADLRVRRALAYAIDRKAISERLLGLAQPAWSDQPQDSWKYNERSSSYYNFNTQHAAKLLSEAGWVAKGAGQRYNEKGEALGFSLNIVNGNKSHQLVGAYLRDAFAKIGVKLELKPVPEEMLLQEILPGGHYELALASWSSQPHETSFKRWHSSQVPPMGNNFTRFVDYQADQLLHNLENANDINQQRAIYKQLASVLSDQLPAIPLYHDTVLEASKKTVHNYHPNPFMGATWNSTNWWIE
jgi:peptide/nickel transport system substrate-binding protein